MKRQLFSLAICLLLFAGLFSFYTNNVKSASGDGIVEVELNVRGTFLRAMDDWPYAGPGEGAYDEELEMWVGTHTDFRVEEATMIDLQDEGFIEGDKIYISWLGGFYPDGAWNPSNPGSIGYGLKENDAVSHGGLLGLFSTSSQLLDIDQLNRVPGAIDYGSNDYITPDTWWKDGRAEVAEKLASKGIDWYTGALETDIPEDFKISPHTGMKVEIPRNARFLFLSLIDPYYRDNYESPNGLTVTIEKDTDEDGIPDNWEINGIDIDKDGETDLDLQILGADWEHKDIFVEVDFGVFGGYNTYHREETFDPVVNSFANAPVENPDNIDGINLHISIDEEAVWNWPEQISWDDFYNIKDAKFGSREDRNNPNIIKAKKQVFHYCLLANRYTNNASGEGEYPGNCFIVSLGERPSAEDLCATFMHELGHNLGLHHGGDVATNFKPNYISVMNYAFQLDPYVTGRPLDFSHGNNSPLDESNLNEHAGIGNPVKTVWRLSNGSIAISDGDLAIDWNFDGNITNRVQLNLNDFPDEPSDSDNEILRDYNDWNNLLYRFRGTEYFALGTPANSHTELTLDEIEEMKEEAKNIVEVTVPESYEPSSKVVSFGLKEGDWFDYSVTWTGGNPQWYYLLSIKGEVVSVSDETVEIQWESQNVAGQTQTSSETYHVNLGGHTINIIPADLEIGDSIFSEDHGVIDIDGEEYYEYSGSNRHILWAVEDFGTIHWDRKSGLLVQSDSDVGHLHRKMLLEKTNAWENETDGLDSILVAALGIIIFAILLFLVILFRRKKKQEKHVETSAIK